MNIYLQSETDFTHNGLGFLKDVLSAKVIDNLNGEYSLNFEYKINGQLSEYLQNENIIKCKVADGSKQLFIIKNVVKTFTSIQINCKHIFYQLLDNFVENVAPTNLSPQPFLKWILDRTNYSHRFNSYSDISTPKSARYVRRNPVDAILGNTDNSMVNLFGGELKRDNFDIHFNKRIGNDNGVKLIVGKNITGINISIDTNSVHTRIMPQGYNGLLIPEKYIDSPLINNYLNPKVYKIEFDDIKYDPEDETAYHDLTEAHEALKKAVEDLYDTGIDKPSINIKIDWIELSKTNEYKHYSNLEKVSLGDTITIDLLGMNYQSRVIKTAYNPLTETIDSLEIGSPKADIGTSTNTIQRQIGKINPTSILEDARNNATQMLLKAMGGYIVKTENELLIMDTDDTNTAKKVWRWNMNGLGYSENGIDGPYKTAITADGKIVADFITTGKLNTNVIEGYESLLLKVASTYDFTREKTANNKLTIEDAQESEILSFSITGEMELLYPDNDLYPADDLYPLDSFLNIENKNGEIRQIHLPLDYLYKKKDVSDEFVLERIYNEDAKKYESKCKVIRRIGVEDWRNKAIEVGDDLSEHELIFNYDASIIPTMSISILCSSDKYMLFETKLGGVHFISIRNLETITDTKLFDVTEDTIDYKVVLPDDFGVVESVSANLLSRFKINDIHKYIRSQELIEELGVLNIPLWKGTNKIYLESFAGMNYSCKYTIINEITDGYATHEELRTSISQSERDIDLSVNQKLEKYSTTEEMNASINIKANAISNSVNASLTNINGEIEEISGNLELKLDPENLCSELNASADKIHFKGNRFKLESTNCTITEDGTIDASNVNLTGVITSTSGKIGGWNLSNSGLSNGDYFIHNNGYSNIFTYVDIVIVRNYLLGKISFTDEDIKRYDLNNDGEVNSAELLLLRQKILNIN